MMNKKIWYITLSIMIVCIMSFATIVGAENLDDLQNKKNEIQEEISGTNEQIQDLQIELTENLEQLNNLNTQISTYENEISSLEENLTEITEEIEKVTSNLNVIEENYKIQKETFENRIIAVYEAGDIYYLDVLLNSNSVSEFISNYYLIGKIAEYDNDILENIERQKSQIESIQQTLTKRKENLSTLKKNKEKATISLENSKIIRNSYIAKLSDDEKAMQERIDKYQAELNNVEAQITLLTKLNIGDEFVGGEFIWPAPGYTTVTSRFGMRFHPVLKVNRVHTGTDIAMPTGSYVIASNDGTVIQSTYSTSYGNMVVIDHGGGITTLYGHGSELIAQIGQEVKKGDLIMKSGSTGWSTGPHLHFEVRINGTPIDSLEFLGNQSKYLIEEENKEDNESINMEETNDNNQTNEEIN